MNSALPFLLFSFAQQHLTASMGAIHNATSPFFGAITAAIWLGEPLTGRKVAGMALGFAHMPGPVTPLVAANVVALASTAVAYMIYFELIADVGPARALTVPFLIPLFGVLWGSLFLAEALTLDMVAGGALIIAGTVLALRAPRDASLAK